MERYLIIAAEVRVQAVGGKLEIEIVDPICTPFGNYQTPIRSDYLIRPAQKEEISPP